MEPQEILRVARAAIREHAGDDPDQWFYANRFVFARLQLDERKTKTHIKRELFQAGKPCHYCNKPFAAKTGVCLHRLDENRGYSLENCVLMHPDCHIACHREERCETSPRGAGDRVSPASPILEKASKRYDGKPFTHWWDISPGFLGKLGRYEAVEFIKSDTGERCHVPTSALREFLVQERQTSRGNGNWGIKVLTNHQGELAFEPGSRKSDWLFLPVVWLNDEQED